MRWTWSGGSPVVLAAALFLLGAEPPPAFAQDPGNDASCMECHSKEEAGRIDLPLLQSAVHGRNACVECHSDVRELPHPKKLKRVTCRKCHNEPAEEYYRSIHAEL